MFFPEPWEDEPILDEYFFQMGWFNHQLVKNGKDTRKRIPFHPPWKRKKQQVTAPENRSMAGSDKPFLGQA